MCGRQALHAASCNVNSRSIQVTVMSRGLVWVVTRRRPYNVLGRVYALAEPMPVNPLDARPYTRPHISPPEALRYDGRSYDARGLRGG
jgi:hypothetical protein